MSKKEFEQLLVDFRKLAEKAGNTPFDLCWHHDPRHDVKVPADSDSHHLVWPEVEESDMPFDTEHRIGFAKLSRLLDTKDKASTVGFGRVTLPRGPALELSVLALVNGGWSQLVPVWHRFRDLSEHAGGVLPPIVRDEVLELWPSLGTDQAPQWYALLFQLHGQQIDCKAVSSTGKFDLTVSAPLWDSVDVIQRCGLNTDNPLLPKADEVPELPFVDKRIDRKEYRRLREIKEGIDRDEVYIGKSVAILHVFQKIDVFNQSELSDEPVLILGPSGAGKSEIAELIHKNSPRAGRPFRRVQANVLKTNEEGTILDFLSGHGKDSPLKDIPKNGRPGILQECDGGTIFIDEVADLSKFMQGLLLDIIDRKPMNLASGRGPDVRPNVRLLFATNADMEDLEKDGTFRHDLLGRIRGQRVQIPPLADRVVDIPLLVRHWASDLSIRDDFYLALFRHDWPFNVRELSQEVRRAIAHTEGRVLSAQTLDLQTARDVAKMNEEDVKREVYETLRGKLEAQGFYKGRGGDLHKEIAGILGCVQGKVTAMSKASPGELG